MSRPALISLPLVESVERYGDALADASRDGDIDPEEQRRLIRLFAAITHRVERLHMSLRFVDLATHGERIDGPWAERRWREDRRDRLYLVHCDDPDPDGPGAGQKKAA